jgi:hypothetical protein
MDDLKKYYVVCGKTWPYLKCSDWPLPDDDGPGEERNAGTDPYSYLIIREMQSVVKRIGERIFRADYYGYPVELPDTRLVTKPRNSIAVRQASLLYELESWGRFTAQTFSCDCMEKIINDWDVHYKGKNLSRLNPIFREGLSLGRRFLPFLEVYVESEKSEFILDLVSGQGEGITPSRDEIEVFTHALKEVEDRNSGLPPVSYLSEGVRRCADPGTDFPLWTKEVAKVARYAKSFMHFSGIRGNHELGDRIMEEAWYGELDWQAAHLSRLLGEDKVF